MESNELKILRNRDADTPTFRKASDALAPMLIKELKEKLDSDGCDVDSMVFVIILRSGIALLPAAIEAFPTVRVAVAGLKRDEETAIAHWYYENFPELSSENTVIILDPMLATGGSAVETLQKLRELNADMGKTYFVGVIAAPEGVQAVTDQGVPEEHLVLGSVDEGLDDKKYIVPGLGDYGDRYFGYADIV